MGRLLLYKPMLSISVQKLSHVLGKITRSSLQMSYLVKVEHTMLIPSRIVIELKNIVETKHVNKLSRAKKIVI